MNTRAISTLLTVIMSVLVAPVAAAQTRDAWTPPRTPWGDPDLQGLWTNATITPLQRPREFAGKPVLTGAEAAAPRRLNKSRRNVGWMVLQEPVTLAPTTGSGSIRETRS